MARKRTVQEIIEDATAFISCQDLNDIQSRLGINKAALIFQGLHPQYYTFTVRKHKGGDRTIEAPQEDLKIIQRKLNTYLQAVYYTIQSPAAYGYIITPKNVKSTKNIVGNAEQHLGCTSMLNVDFKNFFHQISKQRVLHLFMNPPFSFKKKTASILARVTTYKERLPMGAPTSPVLSNLVTSDFDIKMHQWAQHNGITFTRFVDDLTFSHSQEVLDMAYLDTIEAICTSYNLKLNRTKTVFMDVDSPKTITGLVLGTTVDIQPIFYNNLNDDLKRLKSLSEVCAITGVIQDRELLKKFKQEVYGHVNFIGTVEGYRSAIFYDYRQKYKKALEVSEQVFAKRWLHFSYH